MAGFRRTEKKEMKMPSNDGYDEDADEDSDRESERVRVRTRRTKNAEVRCKNCGDRTTFSVRAAGPREKLGWCRPCWLTRLANEKAMGRYASGMGFISDNVD
jgi:hypothetical protein